MDLNINEILEQVASAARDEKGRWSFKAGWYQDIDGRLYKYDGVVWDVVPEVPAASLEYLG